MRTSLQCLSTPKHDHALHRSVTHTPLIPSPYILLHITSSDLCSSLSFAISSPCVYIPRSTPPPPSYSSSIFATCPIIPSPFLSLRYLLALDLLSTIHPTLDTSIPYRDLSLVLDIHHLTLRRSRSILSVLSSMPITTIPTYQIETRSDYLSTYHTFAPPTSAQSS